MRAKPPLRAAFWRYHRHRGAARCVSARAGSHGFASRAWHNVRCDVRFFGVQRRRQIYHWRLSL